MLRRKWTVCVAVAVFFTVGAKSARSEENPEDIGKLARASARLVADYLKQTVDKDTGLWVSQHVNKVHKREPTGKFREVPEIKRKLVGYRDVWRWVSAPTENDPYHKVYKKTKTPIYVSEKTGRMVKHAIHKIIPELSHEDHRFPRWIEGVNALGAYALLCAGEHPESTGLNRVLEWLENLAKLGLPDTTYELSLMIMVFLRADPDRYRDLIDRGVTKLLYGQIAKGPGRGQWGYYSVNWKTLKTMSLQTKKLDKFKGTMKHLRKGKDFVAMTAKEKVAHMKKVELEGAVSWLNRRMKEISREFGLGRFWWSVRWEFVEDEELKKRYYWPNMLYDARELRLGDLLNTEFALMALAEVEKKGWFKKEKQEELKTQRTFIMRHLGGGVRAPSPPDLKVVIARTAAMLKKFQQKDGSWDLCRTTVKTITPYEEMRKIKIDRKPPKHHERIKRHEIEPADPTLIGTACAMHSYSLIGEMVGKQKVRKKYAQSIDRGQVVYEKILKAYLDNPDAIPIHQHAFLPYRYWLTIPSVRDNLGLKPLELGGGDTLLKRMVQTQNADGTFSHPLARKFRNSYMPPPTFPEEVQELWVKEKVMHGAHFYPKVDPRLISSALTLISYARYLKTDVVGPKEWPDAFEYFTDGRNKLLGIGSEKAPDVKPEKKKAEKEPEEKDGALSAKKETIALEPKKEPLQADEEF